MNQYSDRSTNAWMNLTSARMFADDEDGTDYCLDAPEWLPLGSTVKGEYHPSLPSMMHREYL